MTWLRVYAVISPILAVILLFSGLGLGYNLGSGKVVEIEKQVEVVKEVEKIVIEEVEKERTIYRDKIVKIDNVITEVVERPVYRNVCLDDDGLELFNDLMGN